MEGVIVTLLVMVALIIMIFILIARWLFRINHIIDRLDKIIVSAEKRRYVLANIHEALEKG